MSDFDFFNDDFGSATPTPSDSSVNDYPRIGAKFRYFIPNEAKGRQLIFLDDRETITPEMNNALAILGMMQGPFDVREHRLKLPRKSDGKLSWSNWFSDSDRIKLTPMRRLFLFKNLGLWPTIGKFLDEALATGNEDDRIAVYMPTNLDLQFFEGILSEKQYTYALELLELGLDCTWENPLSAIMETKKSKNGEEYEGFKYPSTITSFRTVIDRSEFKTKDGETKRDILKLYGTKSSSTEQANNKSALTNNFKKSTGLSFTEWNVQRSAGLTVPAVGDSMDFNNIYTAEEIQAINPDAVIFLDKASIREELTKNHNYRLHCYWAASKSNLNVDKVVDKIAKALGVSKTGRLFPYVADYQEILMPKSPTYLKKVLGIDVSKPEGASNTDEDIPF